MTDRTTTKLVASLPIGAIVTRCPDRNDPRYGQDGQWIVTGRTSYIPYVRIDYQDAVTYEPGVWVLPQHEAVLVELAGPAMQDQALDLLAGSPLDRLPAVHAWTVTGNGIDGQLAAGSGNAETVREALTKWQEYLGGEDVQKEALDYTDRIKLSVSRVVEGVPFTVWASVDQAAEADS